MEAEARRAMVALLPRLRAFSLSLTRAQPAADDLVQGACERALRALGTFQPGTNFDAWMMRILRNLWIDQHRRLRDETLVDHTDPAAERVGEDGREAVERRSDLRAVSRVLDALPEAQRSVLVLVCVDGLSYRDAAEVLGVPVGTVMSRLARGRSAVAAALEAPGTVRQAGGAR